jgi:hypothetical protein
LTLHRWAPAGRLAVEITSSADRIITRGRRMIAVATALIIAATATATTIVPLSLP